MADPSSPTQPLPATPEALTRVLERRPVLWLGAGLSIAAGYPRSRQVVEAMAGEADDPLDTSRPFLAVADTFVASVGKGQAAELMSRLFRAPRAPAASHRALARLSGAGRFHAVVTTNTDTLFERALDEEHIPYLLQPRDDLAPITGEGLLRVLKIEGSYDDWLRIVVSGRAYTDFGHKYPFLEDQVRAVLRERPVLFVGSSLQDPRLLSWIATLSEEQAEALMPWRALIPREEWDAALAYRYNDGGVEHAARDVLSRAHIRPLLLDGHGELPRLLANVAAAEAPPADASLRVKLRELSLRDFRGFRELQLPLPEESLAILVGVNGAGKSSVLEAIALLLAQFTTYMRTWPKPEGLGTLPFRPMETDIREGADHASVGAAVEMDGETQEWLLKMWPFAPPSEEALRDLQRLIPDDWHRALAGTDMLGIKIQGSLDRLAKTEDASVPVLCHYPASRAMAQELAPQAGQRLRFRQLEAYENAFERTLGPFQDFVRWFRFEEDLENEASARGERGTSPLLDAVREAVERFMSALPRGRFSNLRAERAPASYRGFILPERASLVIDKAGERLALAQLSDGERSLLLLVADVARRLAIANPGLPDPLRGSGIVLIDEIELHLHPAWQRAVLTGLRRAFPGLQIIATTHSPQVLSQVPSQSVILLDGFQFAGAAPPTYGRDTNAILEEVMSVPARPEEAAARLKEVSRLIDEGHLEEARAAVEHVASWLGASDSEVVRLGTMIDFLAD